MLGTDTTDSSNRPRPSPRSRERPGLADNSRGVSEVLGAILMFGLLIALLVLIQVNAVPAQNQQVEFEHNQRVEQDMLGLDRAILDSAMMGVPGSAEIELAAVYPSRFFLLNPSVGAGTVETVGTDETITIEGGHLPSVDNYWDTGTDKTFTTTSIRYRPNYKEYANAPVTVYEHNTLVNVFDTGNVTVDSAGFIEGNKVTLVTVDGSLSHAGDRGYTVETAPVSGPAQTVTLRSDTTSDPITITVPTAVSLDHWSESLEDESRVLNYSVSGGELTVVLEPGTYELRMGRVDVGESAGGEELPPRYLAATDDLLTETIRPTETKELTVQLRDRFNNPANGTVRFTVTGGNGDFVREDGSRVNEVTVEASEDGTASTRFRATTVGEPEVTASIVSETEPTAKTSEHNVTYTIDVSEVGQDTNEDSLSRINPTDTITVRYIDKSGQKPYLGFSNGIDEDVDVTRIRSMFFVSNNNNEPTAFSIETGDLEVTKNQGQTSYSLNNSESVSLIDEQDVSQSRVSISGGWYDVASPTITIEEDSTDIDGGTAWLLNFQGANTIQGTLGVTIEYRAAGGGTFTETYFIQIL